MSTYKVIREADDDGTSQQAFRLANMSTFAAAPGQLSALELATSIPFSKHVDNTLTWYILGDADHSQQAFRLANMSTKSSAFGQFKFAGSQQAFRLANMSTHQWQERQGAQCSSQQAFRLANMSTILCQLCLKR